MTKRQRTLTRYFRTNTAPRSQRSNVNQAVVESKMRNSNKIYRSMGIAAREHEFKRIGNIIVLGQSAVSGTAPDIISGGTGITLGNAFNGNTNGSIQFGGSLSFQLANVVNTSEITTLFDNYKIKSIKLRFDFSYNGVNDVTSGGVNAALGSLPFIHITPDFDDDVVPSTISDVLQHSYCKSQRFYDGGMVMSLSPRAQQTITGGTGSAGGMLPRSTWLDCNSPAIKHYGIKFWMADVPALGNRNAWTLTITPTYYLQAKNVA